MNALLPEVFAAVREASLRTLGLRHFDVQLIGGMALHSGQIAEMRTGEGKTLDTRWMSRLRDMDTLKTGISLRAVGHRDPKLEYKEEAHKAFAALTQSMYEDYLQALLRGQLTVKLKATA